MRIFMILLSFFLVIGLGACRDMNTRNTDNTNTPTNTNTPGQSTNTNANTLDGDRQTNTGTTADRNRNQNSEQHQALTTTQQNNLYKELDLTAEQTRRLEELRDNRSNSDMNQMDRDFRSILDDNQYTKYEQWKRDNL